MDFRRSSRCHFEPPQCVEVAVTKAGVFVRDSKAFGTGPVLEVSSSAWRAFVMALPS
jgi:hypothetical protein